MSLCVEAKGHSRVRFFFFLPFYKALGNRIGREKDGGQKEAKGGKIAIMLTQLTVRCAATRSRCSTVYVADKCPSVDDKGKRRGGG